MAAELQEVEPGFEAEKAREQAYFDVAKAQLDRAIAYRDGPSSGGTAFERRALAAAANRRERLGAHEPVAFGRIDTVDGETRYIGKVAVRDDSTSEVLVWNWQSPAADPYHDATFEDQAGVARRRVFDAPANRIKSFEDELFEQIAEELGKLSEFRSVGDPLLEDLGRARGHYMQDMVRTIQAEQNRLIRSPKDQLLVIQGGPGSGKTAIALHRISWLLYTHHETLAPRDVLFVGPSQTFTKYVRRVLPDLGDEDVVQLPLPQLMAGSDFHINGQDEPRVARLKGTATMAELLRKALYQRVKIPAGGIRIRRQGGLGSVPIDAEAIKAALSALKPSPYSSRRALLKASLARMAANTSDPYINGLAVGIDDKSLEEETEKIWPQVSPQQFVVDLYGSKVRLRAAGATEPQIESLYRAAPTSIYDVRWTEADLAVLDYAIHAINGVEHVYGHIVVDEAQDLSIMQLQALRRRSLDGSMTIVGDIAQATSLYAQKDWDQTTKYLGSELPANVEVLEVGYRVPKKAMDIASRVLEEAAPEIAAPQAIRDVDDEPRWILCEPKSLSEAVADAVQDHSRRGLFVGVIAPESHWPAITSAFMAGGLRWSESSDGGLSQGINLVTPHDSKGLEFDAVVVVDPARILETPQGAKLLYIALTRTVHYLDVVLPSTRVPGILEGFIPPDEKPEEEATPERADREEPDRAEHDDTIIEAEAMVSPLLADAEEDQTGAAVIPIHRDAVAAASGRPESAPLQNSMWESFAQSLAERIAEDLRENAGPAVQRRILALLKERLNED
ncbi:DNA helicase IV [Sinomonas atrocyanea]|uniref:HelD family protein n=1 Tax=Sinomonas atrocyanea TaxID=37927 RepID=UPI00278AD76B|nr:ATP-binding domain-containing protein [Sinomonas atrocyanea]MDQ0260460.1 DNA helicase IV [Sinomonas atrocyanea]